jgi:hypothetical protein
MQHAKRCVFNTLLTAALCRLPAAKQQSSEFVALQQLLQAHVKGWLDRRFGSSGELCKQHSKFAVRNWSASVVGVMQLCKLPATQRVDSNAVQQLTQAALQQSAVRFNSCDKYAILSCVCDSST